MHNPESACATDFDIAVALLGVPDRCNAQVRRRDRLRALLSCMESSSRGGRYTQAEIEPLADSELGRRSSSPRENFQARGPRCLGRSMDAPRHANAAQLPSRLPQRHASAQRSLGITEVLLETLTRCPSLSPLAPDHVVPSAEDVELSYATVNDRVAIPVDDEAPPEHEDVEEVASSAELDPAPTSRRRALPLAPLGLGLRHPDGRSVRGVKSPGRGAEVAEMVRVLVDVVSVRQSLPLLEQP